MEIHVQKEPSDTIHFYLFVLTQSSQTMQCHAYVSELLVVREKGATQISKLHLGS